MASAKPNTHVVYDRQGSALVLFGGDKLAPVPEYRLRSVQEVFRATAGGLFAFSVSLRDTDHEPYGDSVVATGFIATAESSDSPFTEDDWVEISGKTQTGWMGNYPLYRSDEIHLSETWTFRFEWLDLLQYPVGTDYQERRNAITWEGHDTSGNYGLMTHYYGGLFALGNSPERVMQYSAGTHKFTADGLVYVTAAAKDFKSI
jgi:hypothetical protein